ncbi:MAG TPA: lipid-A-disaccharide synthase [Candidatus Acidoferrales bacterium]|nr:lipid-A-disaccharide synthase [Candidatus Acidoferrales bacterium]
MTPPQILISAGEASGDMYAGRLAAELIRRTGAHMFGMGGEKMRQAGVELVAQSSDVAVSGISEVWSKLPELRRTMARMEHEAEARKPQLAILTDFPSFHVRLASKLQRQTIRCVCFIAPQFWAWRPWRAKLIARRFIQALCIFPFEEDFYRKAGVTVSFIGHPLVDIVRPTMSRSDFLKQQKLDSSRPIVALLPGSRMNELQHNLPAILDGCGQIALQKPGCQFVLALASGFTATLDPAPGSSAQTLRMQTGAIGHSFRVPANVDLRVATGTTYDVVAAASAAIVASGTATVETALLGTPMVVVYRVARLTELVVRTFVTTKYVAMPNLIAGRAVVPELLQQECTGPRIAGEIVRLLDSQVAREEMQRGLAEVRAKLGPGGAIERAAEIITGLL